MILQILSWCATGSSLIGQWLINNKKRSAFVVWIASNVLWIIVNIISTFNMANVVMYIVYTIMNIHGFISWKNKE